MSQAGCMRPLDARLKHDAFAGLADGGMRLVEANRDQCKGLRVDQMFLLPALQKDALQTGVPLEMSAKLASHTADEAKRYSANTSYELNDVTTLPLKLVSAGY